jgi:hypothetical protein
MGPPTLLGGGTFEIDEGSIVPLEGRSRIWRRHRDAAAFAILSAIVLELQGSGFESTKVRRGKPDDVRCKCTLGSAHVDLILVAEKGSGTTRPFFLMAWDFSQAMVLGKPLTEEQSRVWQQLCSTTDDVIQKRFSGTPLTRLSPSDIDARFAARRDVE